ncbi:GNAT family N-acetyltransferase [Tepidiforma flava]|uniref:GNAT family N-acetyltransferase n=1 Tax=Tepidiforma flava TaxID=3004094 RepID=A0ABY7M5T9_9CHLR|nr:GNAT family N-acetyltransferase [Tepidiforma flava]WBL35902.1 GNAT family N-acetyltransferase [Tepidiforma flava]
MSIDIRPCADRDELREYARIVSYVFASEEGMEDELSATQPEWTVCAFVDGKMASTLGVWPFTVRLNGSPVPMGGVTAVGTLPNYRRRGLLRRTMRQALETMYERRQPLAILWASMAAIYQRFGYGLASTGVTYRFDPRLAALAQPIQDDGGRIELLSPEEAYPIIKPLFIAWATPRNLVIHRSAELWRVSTFRPPKKGLPVHVAVYRDGGGAPQGYAVYSVQGVEHQPDEGEQELRVAEFVALTPGAWASLWEFLRAHDLARRVEWKGVPPDDQAPELLLEPRVLNRRTQDAIWMRVVDAAGALAARPYGAEGRLAIRITSDPECPWNEGTWLLEAQGSRAEARRFDGEPDLTLPPAVLASLLAGHRSATFHARAGRLAVRDDHALRLADAMFRTEYEPFCPNGF